MKEEDSMDPRFETRGAFRVLGVEDDAYKIEKVDPGFHDLWMNKYMSKHDTVKSYSTDGAHYAVWSGTTQTDIGKGRYLAGMAVRNDATVPDGWIIREVPAARYAVFGTTLRDVGDATEHALNRWLPQSEYELDIPKPRFDLMPPDTTGHGSPVSVWIPVRKRA
jgi:predicted transcriptional regulator YdeE